MSRLTEIFPAGPPISEQLQIGRLPAIEGLEARMHDREKVKLLEPRRVGKSSVADAVVDRLRAASVPTASIDLAELGGGASEAAEALAAQLAPGLAAVSRARRAGGWLASLLANGSQGDERLLADVIDRLADGGPGPAAVLSRVADATDGGLAVVLIDEAHHLASWPSADREGLREFLRNDVTMGVIVASSEASALEVLTGRDGPLRYVAQRFLLPPIDREDWLHALPRRFEEVDAPISRDGLALLLDEARGHPYCTMLLAREAARTGQPIGEVTATVVEAALLVVAGDEAWELRDDLG